MVRASVRKLRGALSSRMLAPPVQSLPYAGGVELVSVSAQASQPNVITSNALGRERQHTLYSGEKVRRHDFYAGFAIGDIETCHLPSRRDVIAQHITCP